MWASQRMEHILICCVCLGDNSEDTDEIIQCDNCGVTVHEGQRTHFLTQSKSLNPLQRKVTCWPKVVGMITHNHIIHRGLPNSAESAFRVTTRYRICTQRFVSEGKNYKQKSY